MSYDNTDVRQIFEVTRAGKGKTDKTLQAMAWIEAENIMACRELICKWFDLLESGEAENKYPDPTWKAHQSKKALSVELVAQFFQELDEDFMIEKGRFPDSDPEKGPAFGRLPEHARMAFMQELYSVIKTEAELEAEAVSRLRSGEQIPPD